MTSTQSPNLTVIHHPAGTGPAVWFGDAVYTFKATTENTGGTLTLAEATVPPGSGPPPHRHPSMDEAFFVLAGELEFLNGEDTFIAGEGDFVFVPRGTRHRFRNVGLHHARLIFLFTTPVGVERFFQTIGTPARRGETPPPMTPEQQRQIVEIAADHGIELAP